MQTHKALAAIAALAIMSMTTAANAVFTTDQAFFNSIMIDPTIIDFEGVAPSAKSSPLSASMFSSLGVTFSGNGSYYDQAYTSVNLPNPAPSDWACVPCFRGPALTIYFSNEAQPLIDGVGFNIAVGGRQRLVARAVGPRRVRPGAHPGEVSVEVFNGSTLLANGTFDADNFTGFDTFVGVYGLGAITSVRITPMTDEHGPHRLGIDNLTFGDPPVLELAVASEPGTLALTGLGLLGLSFVRRRKTEPR